VSVVRIADTFQLISVDEKLMVEIKVPELKTNLLGNVFSLFGKKKDDEVKLDKNQIDVEVFKKVAHEKILFAKGKGNYARYIEIGGHIYYQHSKLDTPVWTIEVVDNKTLPSCSLLRKDIKLLHENKLKEATELGK